MATISCNASRHCSLQQGRTIFDYADELAVRIPTSCGRSARCHECIVEVTRGVEMLSPRADVEDFLRGNFRLACQAHIEQIDSDIEFAPIQRRPRILTNTPEATIELDPIVTRVGEQVCYDGQAVDRYRGRMFGVALDVGTTTMVIELVDLETGKTAAQVSLENPQRFGGSDVMNRISYDSGPFHGELH